MDILESLDGPAVKIVLVIIAMIATTRQLICLNEQARGYKTRSAGVTRDIVSVTE